jgi:predicted HD phosphohydrolase
VRLHVEAKRYLCAVDPEYRASLSPVSEASLILQGGVLDLVEQRRFLEQPFATDAIRLRCLDDRAKVPGKRTPPLAHFIALLATIALSPQMPGQRAAVHRVHVNLR